MTDQLTARLTENQRIIEAATDGPWAWSEERNDDWTLDNQGPNLETVKRTEPHPFDGSTGAEETVISAWGHDAWGIFVEEHDKEFIATARMEWPKANAVLRKVLELHQRHGMYELCIAPTCDGQDHDHFETQDGDIVHGDVLEYWSCSICLDEDGEIEWPCPTVQAITDAMGGGE